MTPRHVRAMRGAAAAWAATIVAATSHTFAGGGAPAPLLVLAVGILASPVAVVLVGRRLTAWRVGATVIASQVPFHLAFALTAEVDPAAATLGHIHSPALATGAAAGGFPPDASMLVGHVLAAVATMLALYSGERMLRALGRGIRSLLSRARAVVPPTSAGRSPGIAVTPAPRVDGIVLSDLSRRGPPALVVAAL